MEFFVYLSIAINLDLYEQFVRIDNMTCSYRDSIKEPELSHLGKAKSECIMRQNCTAVRTNKCLRLSEVNGTFYDFCNDDPVPSDQLGTTKTTTGLSARSIYIPAVCVYVKTKSEFISIAYLDITILFIHYQ